MAIVQLIGFAPFITGGLSSVTAVNEYTPAYLNVADAGLNPPAISAYGSSLYSDSGFLYIASGTSNGQIGYTVCVWGVPGRHKKTGVWWSGCSLGGGRGSFITPVGATLQSGSLPYKNPADRYYEVKIDWVNKTLEYRLAGIVIATYTFTDPDQLTVKLGFNANYPYTGGAINDIYLAIDNEEHPGDVTGRYLGPLTISTVPISAVDGLTTDNTVVGGLTAVDTLNKQLGTGNVGYVTTSAREKEITMTYRANGITRPIIGMVAVVGAFKGVDSAAALYQRTTAGGVTNPPTRLPLPNSGQAVTQKLVVKANSAPFTVEEVEAARVTYYSKHD